MQNAHNAIRASSEVHLSQFYTLPSLMSYIFIPLDLANFVFWRHLWYIIEVISNHNCLCLFEWHAHRSLLLISEWHYRKTVSEGLFCRHRHSWCADKNLMYCDFSFFLLAAYMRLIWMYELLTRVTSETRRSRNHLG